MPQYKVTIEEVLKAEYEITVEAEDEEKAEKLGIDHGHEMSLDQKNVKTLDYSVFVDEVKTNVPEGMIYNEYFHRRNPKRGEFVGFKIEAKFRDNEGDINTVDDAEHFEFLHEEGTEVFWSIYGVNKNGTVECLGDFNSPKAAIETAKKLGARPIRKDNQ